MAKCCCLTKGVSEPPRQGDYINLRIKNEFWKELILLSKYKVLMTVDTDYHDGYTRSIDTSAR